ncbi:MAG: cell filamentation protein Fic [Omnitrophica WOR_2 bacterium RIFCSPLOWO2_12_FULL_50_9]|nr:MAG: cell filamentation protein Fic [Omnitrophica WOR_2 bacterium RIFCSPHIGHO2_02_FULL_50_17]OGX43067.1 MAG: cell filamentation protein Fic [Omnitrophica WOR_2 bacterium RIFCSPLOWO2_12_FULL_50_9]
MKTFQQFEKAIKNIPTTTSWYLADLGEARGKQELFTKQSPQKLKVLREHALIESAVSSNRIEGVTVNQKRVGTVVFGKRHLKDRNEEEVRCYRTALDWIHREGIKIPISEKTIFKLHEISRGEIWDAGKYKEKNVDIIEKLPGGRERIRFKTVEASKTPAFMKHLIESWQDTLKEKNVHPLIALAAFNLDFLCVHPFRDGNGRVSRLLLLLQCYSLGYEVGRYISLERLIEQNKERYYETLEQSSHRWHDGKHDPWPYINYLLYILKIAYQEFESRVGQMKSPRGAKTELVEAAIASLNKEFAISDLEKACPGVSRDMIRIVMNRLRKEGRLKILGRGRDAKWAKLK